MNKGIIYYSGGGVPDPIANKVREQIRSIGLPIVSATLQPLHNTGRNVVLSEEKGYLAMFKQILAALEASTSEVVFFCEHDNFYHPSHFNFTPRDKDTFYYDHNWWKIGKGDLAVHWDADQVSGLCCYRDTAIEFYKQRIATFDPNNFDRKFEPMSGVKSESWRAEYPSIDIRGSWNLTKSKWSLDDFRDKSTAKNFEESTIDAIPGWDAQTLHSLIQ